MMTSSTHFVFFFLLFASLFCNFNNPLHVHVLLKYHPWLYLSIFSIFNILTDLVTPNPFRRRRFFFRVISYSALNWHHNLDIHLPFFSMNLFISCVEFRVEKPDNYLLISSRKSRLWHHRVCYPSSQEFFLFVCDLFSVSSSRLLVFIINKFFMYLWPQVLPNMFFFLCSSLCSHASRFPFILIIFSSLFLSPKVLVEQLFTKVVFSSS